VVRVLAPVTWEVPLAQLPLPLPPTKREALVLRPKGSVQLKGVLFLAPLSTKPANRVPLDPVQLQKKQVLGVAPA
jgi:hypothetical protein